MLNIGIHFIDEVRRVNCNVLPVMYSDIFYNKIKKEDSIVIKRGIIGMKEKDKYILMTLAVYTKFQGKGYGSKLVECFIQKVKEKGIRKIEVQVQIDNKNAIEFYTKFGFRKIKIIPRAYPRLPHPNGYLYELIINTK
ncbi:N-acetyltransferase separation anxiety, putative [Entamoeba dispar SAW760]|uniref:N-acetyltransferase separation anxiety, putative n=1 Tax=Entamoeba dispar (strain ATCC PRA-260 / SAW760) TaxID=370354 RepID=B0E5E3_ENTDS|nr:N-acetyltransferase separation anxiety, putative [Entamoeba dispar SAW760]EDR30235.1 N-acetyltransferase separation anxiety, putative [Entamoeba dispar SAW760]|eukprot:EDR30235.1 N-acetyltransferase separation anxiety, putative [Entamoeba dispar SAW760]